MLRAVMTRRATLRTWMSYMNHGMGVGTMNARLQCPELANELVGAASVWRYSETPGYGARIAGKNHVCRLQQRLTRQMVLTAPRDLVPVLRWKHQDIPTSKPLISLKDAEDFFETDDGSSRSHLEGRSGERRVLGLQLLSKSLKISLL